MNYPRTTRSSRRLMTSKPRFFCDGMVVVYVNCYFSLPSRPYSLLRGPLKPTLQAIDVAFPG
jgi:hypothetical protein